MKIFLLLTLLIGQFAFAAPNSPREAFRTYLKAMVNIKNHFGNKSENYETAIQTFEGNYEADEGIAYADKLIKVLDKIRKVDYDKIPLETSELSWVFDKRYVNGHELEISVVKIDNSWFFSKKTLLSLEYYTHDLKNTKVVEGVTPLKTVSDKIRGKLPTKLTEKYFLIENWQWLGFILLLIIGFILENISKSIITFILNHSTKWVQLSDTDKLSKAINPLAKLIFIFTVMQLIPILDFSPTTTAILKRGLYIAMSFMTVWFGHKVIQYLSDYFATKAGKTSTKFDDILVPLLTKTAFVIIYMLGGLLVLSSLTIDVTGLIAGLGIGGLAFAFAAKDTLANFFGSIMLVLDRPFDIGDVIKAGDIEGTVTEVGFRSTRIRTFNDSIISISNGELMNIPIDNKGKRRFRRFDTNLGLEYDTPPEKIEAFCEGIRQIILSHRWTRKDNFHVYFTSFGASSLDIKMIVYWITEDYSRELAEKHRLMIDILRLAKELEISFAFPTQTVHMFSETKQAHKELESEYIRVGIEMAQSLITKPMSLKNPRSNVEDKNQFGDNDIGID